MGDDCSSTLSSSSSTVSAKWQPQTSATAQYGPVTTRSRITFGKDTILAAKLRIGEHYVGQVVKVLRSNNCAFVRFGDAAGVCEKDGMVRCVPAHVSSGKWVKVAVKAIKVKSKAVHQQVMV